jgi:hypothetical protein
LAVPPQRIPSLSAGGFRTLPRNALKEDVVAGPRLAFVAATAACIALGAVVTNPSRPEGIASSNSREIHDAEVPAPHIAGPFYPWCQELPFDVNQFDSLSPQGDTGVGVTDRAHILQVCDDGAVNVLTASSDGRQ